MTTATQPVLVCAACGKPIHGLAAISEFCIVCYSTAVEALIREMALDRLRRSVRDARWAEFDALPQRHPERKVAHARWREAAERMERA